jgi:hypothetical protein
MNFEFRCLPWQEGEPWAISGKRMSSVMPPRVVVSWLESYERYGVISL